MAAAASRQTAAVTGPRIDARKLRARIEALSVFGRPAGGAFADGVSRVAYSDADVEGRRYVMAQMKAAGLQPRIDQYAHQCSRHGVQASSTDYMAGWVVGNGERIRRMAGEGCCSPH